MKNDLLILSGILLLTVIGYFLFTYFEVKKLNIKTNFISFVWDIIKHFYKETPRSVLFWNSIVYIITIAGYIIYPEAAAFFTLGVGSFIFLVMLIDIDDKLKKHLWIALTAFFWLILITFTIISLGEYIYNSTILPFNNWLNKPKNGNN